MLKLHRGDASNAWASSRESGAKCDTTLYKELAIAAGTISNPILAKELLDAFDMLFGLHAGFRPAHAKGLICSGTFTPAAGVVWHSPWGLQQYRLPPHSRVRMRLRLAPCAGDHTPFPS